MNAGHATPYTRRRPGRALSAALLGLLVANAAESPAQQPPDGKPPPQPPALTQQPGVVIPADKAAIDRAINFGVEFLRRTQRADGGWIEPTAGHSVGYACLAGLALIECGVPTTDGGIVRAANWVRSKALDLDNTYEASLAILLLDRMNGRSDKIIIQGLAMRLIAAQSGTGGWGYKLPKLSTTEQTQMTTALKKLNPNARSFASSGPSFRDRPASLGLCIKASDDVLVKEKPLTATPPVTDPEKLIATATAGLPEKLKRLPALGDPNKQLTRDPVEKRNELVNPTTDNSNTHFAMLAMWAARRHDVATERTFSLVIKRFRTSQSESGQWAYDYARGGGGGTPAMTCVAMLGMAIGHALEPEPGVKPEADPKTLKAFGAVTKMAGEPVGRTDNRPTVKAAGGLYFLWALERIGVLYDVSMIGKKDWYLWGAEILLCHQSADGSWAEGGYHGEHPVVNTSLALLFLKRANLTAGLNKKLRLDSSSLTAKVTTDAAPPPKAPTPPPPIESPAPVDTPPPPVVTPPPPPPAPAPTPAATTAVEPPKEKSSLPWILLLIVLLVGGGLGFFAWRAKKRREAEEEEEERKEKKRNKKKKKAVVLVEDDD